MEFIFTFVTISLVENSFVAAVFLEQGLLTVENLSAVPSKASLLLSSVLFFTFQLIFV